jgi:phasin family protein
MLGSPHDQIDAVKANTEAFLTLSKITFAGMARLSALNVKVARSAQAETMATSNAVAQIKDLNELFDLRHSVSETALETASTYLRDAQAIAVDTQKQVTTLITSYIPSIVGNLNTDASWNQGFKLMNQFAQQMTAMTVTDIKTAGEVTTPITAPVVTDARKAA